MRNISKYHFPDEGVLLNSIMDIMDMAVGVRGGAVKIFHFKEVMNEVLEVMISRGNDHLEVMTSKWKDYRNSCKDLKFLICALYVSKLS